MIGEYKISRASKRCSIGNRPLEPGEVYYSVVTEVDEEFQRVDIAADAWKGPPEDAIGWWKNRIPLPEEKKRELAPVEVLLDLLRSMESQPGQEKRRYLLALMLLRKRQVNAVDQVPGKPRQDAPGSAPLLLQANSDGSTFEVAVCSISATEAETLQEQLMDLIYRDVE